MVILLLRIAIKRRLCRTVMGADFRLLKNTGLTGFIYLPSLNTNKHADFSKPSDTDLQFTV